MASPASAPAPAPAASPYPTPRVNLLPSAVVLFIICVVLFVSRDAKASAFIQISTVLVPMLFLLHFFVSPFMHSRLQRQETSSGPTVTDSEILALSAPYFPSLVLPGEPDRSWSWSSSVSREDRVAYARLFLQSPARCEYDRQVLGASDEHVIECLKGLQRWREGGV
ncbi:hypothetical protein F4808DRAFT_465079 [Astrocystis sublimbata]|nr:hypothetical protein F4808DRAFT_465072 [Astrocystis sublimbata]KAI0192494.1 hypothetical protein F4808DRAFT_465079 [Astrocystis sublimbata]